MIDINLPLETVFSGNYLNFMEYLYEQQKSNNIHTSFLGVVGGVESLYIIIESGEFLYDIRSDTLYIYTEDNYLPIKVKKFVNINIKVKK